MSRREAVIAKVVKMLRLARNAGTDAEAHTALTLAQRLMYAHDISEGDVETTEDAEPIDDNVVDDDRARLGWKEYLAAIVAENFRCAFIISVEKASGRTRLVFVGRKDDVAVATEAYVAAVLVGTSLAEACAATRLHHHKDEARASFYSGFLKGLDEAFRASAVSNALLVVADAAVVAHASALTNVSEADGAALPVGDVAALREGIEAGHAHASAERRLPARERKV
jgi:hypothetical protein